MIYKETREHVYRTVSFLFQYADDSEVSGYISGVVKHRNSKYN